MIYGFDIEGLWQTDSEDY